MPTLEIRNVNKTYKKGTVKALADFSVTLTPGVYGLLGPNGAGKSTLINIITDNINSDSGKVLYNGENIKALGKNYRSVLGYMPQQQGLYDDFTLNRFLWYMAALKGLKKKQAKDKIALLLETVNLTSSAHKKLGSFSGGMKQRALIAQALLNEPEILILDEPTAGLDPKERIRIRNFISEIAEDKIVLISTHVVSDIEFIAKEIILLKSGQLISHDTCNNLLKEIKNKVYEIEIEREDLKYLQDNYRVSNLYNNEDKVIVRIVTDNPPKNYTVQSVNPSIEDLYLYVFENGV
ncbi:MAG: ABC transporter ATP-binding protein [Ruminococcus sp.]|nr:ABC transporter ATP-binding protein [Ruminococcus sp.]